MSRLEEEDRMAAVGAVNAKRDALPEEPAVAEAAVTVAVRLPDGARLRNRRWRASDRSVSVPVHH